MYVADMTVAEARVELADALKRKEVNRKMGWADSEQLLWDIEDLKGRIAEG